MPSYSPVNALLRGMDVLRALNEIGHGSVGDLHRLTEIPKPTIVRILETFKAAGYVADMTPGESYCLTARVLSLSSGFSEAGEIVRIAVPLIDTFRSNVIWPSDVAIFDSNEMLIINTSRKPGTLSVNRTVGSRVPLLITALGRAYCSTLPKDQLNKIVTAIAEGDYADSELARQPRVLNNLFRKTRERGYAISDRENISTIRAIALPILRHDVAVGAFNIIVVADALSAQKMENAYAKKMQQLCRQIAAAMAKNAG